MKPADRRGAWKAETSLKRLRRCLALLRTGDFVTAREQERILKRVTKWKKRHALPSLIRRHPATEGGSGEPASMRNTIEEKFRAFHAANPFVYTSLIKLTKERFFRGTERHGMKALFEQLRWRIATAGVRLAEGYRFDNNFTSRYVRMLVAEYPAYRGLFELRHLRAP